MSSPDPTFAASPASALRADPPQPDGWRASQAASNAPPDLGSLRAELDQIDDSVHDLLMRRAKVVEQVARSGKPAAFRPGREASIIRRLIGRHHGALPPVTLFRMWRELLAGTTAMQGGVVMAVCDVDPTASLAPLAREHFGVMTPLRIYGSPGQALAEVSHGTASVAVLPFPSDVNTWWIALPRHEPRLHVVARLPFWNGRPEAARRLQAVVVAATPPDASGQDRSFLQLECDSDVSRTRLSGELTGAGLTPGSMEVLRPQGSPVAHVLIEVDGILTDDDPRLTRLGAVLRRPAVIGSYAVPSSEPT